MNARTLILAALTLFISADVLAQSVAPRARTIVVRDGKLIENGDILLDTELFGPRTYLGVTLIELTPELRAHFGAPKETGVLVSAVDSDSPAGKAGIRVGDILLAVDGSDVVAPSGLRRALRDKKEGDTARVDLLRGKSRQTVVATVAQREGTPFVLPNVRSLAPRHDAEWRARVMPFADCADMKTRLQELETKLKELEKKIR